MRVSPAVPISIAALMLAGTGGAYAATQITGAQIKNGSITGIDIKNKSLTTSDFKGSVAGPRGSQGTQGLQGPAGAPATTTVTRVSGLTVAQGASGSGAEVQTSVATCPPGTVVTGGGYVTGSILDVVSYALSSPSQYVVIAVNEFSQANSITAQAVCAGGSSASMASVSSSATPATVMRLVQRMQAKLDASR